MNHTESMALIHRAIQASAYKQIDLSILQPETHLVEDGLLSSVDIMVFLCELENEVGHRIEAFDERFSDFRLATIADILERSQA